MNDWQDQYLPRRPNPVTQSWPSNEVRRQERAPYGFAVVIAICLGAGFALMMGIMLAVKTIPQAAQDCAEYCEKESQ